MKVWEFKVTNGNRRWGHVDPEPRRAVRCTRSEAIRALRDEDGSPMTEIGLFGLYVERYEDRYKRRWPFTAEGSAATVRDLAIMAARVGPEEAAKVIRLIFSAKFKWVTNHAAALANKDFYAKHLIPALDETITQGGEQSEWRRGRRDERGFEEVEL